MPRSPRFACSVALLVLAALLACLPPPAMAATAVTVGEAPGAAVVLRTYRIALPSDPTYAAAVAPTATTETESDAQVLAAKTALVARLNQVYGDELAIRFVLAPGSGGLNLRNAAEATGANGPCGTEPCFTTDQLAAGCSDDLMRRTRNVVGQLVGARNYEIGHLLLGAAAGSSSYPSSSYPSSAGTEYRAFGCSGSPTPTGDGFALDVLAHELGHQLGAGATFDGTSCVEPRDTDAAVEPGSGSSIMGAAGTCGVDDLQADADPWFAGVSQDEIGWYVTGEGDVPEDAVAMEVQSVALRGFDGSDSFKLSFGGTQTATITRGVNYTADGVKAAVLAAVPSALISKVRAFWQTGSFDDRGFEMTFAGYTNVVEPTVVPVGGSFTAAVGDIDEGGLQKAGGAPATTANHTPVVTAPADRTIPVRTPFALTGSATDSDADALTYQWQQVDGGGDLGLALTDPAKTDGPLFRTTAPTPGGTRVFPDLAQVVAGRTNAATGTCAAGAGALDCYSEWLPTTAYTPSSMRFRLVARDRDAAGGGVSQDEVVLTVNKAVGPFQVTSQGLPATLTGGSAQTVTWTANTAALAADVAISLSTDGGQTFGTVLAASTPNDGSQVVTLPEVAAGAARIRVAAVGNYFFDVNDADLTITAPPVAGLTVTGVPASATTQHSDALTFGFGASSGGAGSESLAAEVTGLPTGLTLVKTPTSASGVLPGTAVWAVTGTAQAAPGSYPVHLTVTDGLETEELDRTVVVTRESATVGYDGDTAADADQGGDDAVDLTLSATVTEVADGTHAALTTATVSFTDATSGDTLCAAVPVAVTGTASCTYAADLPTFGGRTLQVVPTVGGWWLAPPVAPTPVVVTAPGPPPPPPPPSPPQTSLTSRPPVWLAATSTSVGYASTEAGSTFRCTLDGSALSCGGASVALSGLRSGTHRFTVAARDAEGALDPTPATTVFTVPVDDRQLKTVDGGWKQRTAGAAYEGTFTTAHRKDANLSRRVSGVTALALVVGTAPDHGRVRVFLDGVLVGRVSLDGRTRWRTVVPLATFASPRNGVVRIETVNKLPVRIDGLGVATSAS